MKVYKYGMRLREFGMGCQPSGSLKHEYTDKFKCGYWSIIYYIEPLTEKQIHDYDLEFLGDAEL